MTKGQLAKSNAESEYRANHPEITTPQNDDYLRELGIEILPFQKVSFKIEIKSLKNKIFIINDDRKVLYSQSAKNGYFKFTTKDSPAYLIIYDLINNKVEADNLGGRGIFNDLNAGMNFGIENIIDATVTINAKLLPEKLDTANKRFVRFYYRQSATLLDPNFSISLEKIPPISIRTEPGSRVGDAEYNIITDSLTYLLFKKFIADNKSKLRSDTAGITYHQTYLEINIDFKQYYYLKMSEISPFFRELLSYNRANGIMNDSVLEQLKANSK